MSASVDVAPWRQQSTQSESQCQDSLARNMNAALHADVPHAPPLPSVSTVIPPPPPPMSSPTPTTHVIPPPPAPAPPPPPLPTLNAGNLPSMKLKSEISGKLEPPSKLQSAMTKDKKPFTYAPGGIDFSEIKSPRMQRRIIRNAQEPEDIVLPTTTPTPVNSNLLPPAACVGMMPQIAIPVFPQGNPTLSKKCSVGRPVSPSSTTVERPISPSLAQNMGRPVSPNVGATNGRVISPMPGPPSERPMSPVQVGIGRLPTSPAVGRPISPKPVFQNERPMSPPQTVINGRPTSPAVGRPMSPMSVPFNERPMPSVHTVINGRPTSPAVGRPMSPLSVPFNERPMPSIHTVINGRPTSPAVGRPMSPMSVPFNERPMSSVQTVNGRPISPAVGRPMSPNSMPIMSLFNSGPNTGQSISSIPASVTRPMSPISTSSAQRPRSPIPPPPPQRTQHSHLPQHYSSMQKSMPASNNPNVQPKNTSSVFPVLKECPSPWLQKQNQPVQENVAPWANRQNEYALRNEEPVEKFYECKPKATTIQIQQNNIPNMNSSTNLPGAHVIPIRIEAQNQFVHSPNQQQSSMQRQTNPQRWQNNNGETCITVQSQNNRMPSNSTNKIYIENDPKPIQSRSFKVLQKITGSEDDTTDFNSTIPYNSEGVPLSQLRKLHLNDDDQTFMNHVKAQVDDDTFLHTETDPRYRGAAIPSKAFRMLQNMTDAGQVTTNPNTAAQNHNYSNHVTVNSKQPRTNVIFTENKPTVITQCIDNETNTKAYIPPSERQAEQELRKYMGSSIPSRSFRMLQAMTATQDPVGRDDETDF